MMITLGPARSRLLERVSAPAAEPVTLQEAKLYLRVDGSEEDTLVSDLITSARVMAEHWLRRSLISQTWKLAFDGGVADCVRLPMGPVSSIGSVALVARDESSVTVDSGQYWLNAAGDSLNFDAMQAGHRVEITYHTGYGDAADIPEPIRQGLLAHIAQLYENRGDALSGMPAQAAGLYLPFREMRL